MIRIDTSTFRRSSSKVVTMEQLNEEARQIGLQELHYLPKPLSHKAMLIMLVLAIVIVSYITYVAYWRV
jgi:hypothetical protein